MCGVVYACTYDCSYEDKSNNSELAIEPDDVLAVSLLSFLSFVWHRRYHWHLLSHYRRLLLSHYRRNRNRGMVAVAEDGPEMEGRGYRSGDGDNIDIKMTTSQ